MREQEAPAGNSYISQNRALVGMLASQMLNACCKQQIIGWIPSSSLLVQPAEPPFCHGWCLAPDVTCCSSSNCHRCLIFCWCHLQSDLRNATSQLRSTDKPDRDTSPPAAAQHDAGRTVQNAIDGNSASAIDDLLQWVKALPGAQVSVQQW